MVLVGMGERADYSLHSVAHLAGAAVRFLSKRNIKRLAILPRSGGETSDVVQYAVQGCITSQFELDKYKTKDKSNKAVDSAVICIPNANTGDLKNASTRTGCRESMNLP